MTVSEFIFDEGRWCPRCKLYKSHDYFGSDRSKPEGLHTYCKTCAAERSREWADEHRERSRETRRNAAAKYRADPAKRERVRAYARARSKALSALAQAHPQEYETLLDAAREEATSG
jgi:hypothetical protein